MKFTGTVKKVMLAADEYSVTFTINEPEALNALRKFKEDGKLIMAEVDEYRNKRGRDANACLWWCLGRIAKALTTDTWAVYLKMLRRYGVFETVTVNVDALENLRKKWRESEIIGSRIINKRLYCDVNLYFGSSTYDTEEFSALLDGVISEMKDMGLEPPLPEEVRTALEKWGKHEKRDPA